MLAYDLSADVSTPLDQRKVDPQPGDFLTGLVVLLDPRHVVTSGGKIVTFTDHGVTQADATKRATLATSAAFSDEPVAVFAGVSSGAHCFYTLPNLSALTACEAFIVLACTYGTGGIPFPNDTVTGLWSTGNGLPTHYPHDSGGIYESFGTTARYAVGPPAITMTQPHVYTLRSAAGLFAVAHNAAAPLFTTASNTVQFSAAPVLGVQGSVALNASVALLAICDRVQTTEARAAFYAYLADRFGIAM